MYTFGIIGKLNFSHIFVITQHEFTVMYKPVHGVSAGSLLCAPGTSL